MSQSARPVLVTGTKDEFLRWLSEGNQKAEIQLPEINGPSVWPVIALASILSPPDDAVEANEAIH